jgi:alpha-L-rhamnosidase
MRIKLFRVFIALELSILGLLAYGPLTAASQPPANLAAGRLRCEARVNPLGIDAPNPRLDWIVESSGRGQRQSAYRIIVSSSESNLEKETGDLWDTGKVESDETFQIVYQGKPLKTGMRCFWKVRVWNGEGNPSAWSESAKWSVGFLSASDWQAQWIGYDTARNSLTHDLSMPLTIMRALIPWVGPKGGKVYLPCPYLRKSFAVDKPVKRAIVYVTALGLYELYLNGQRVGNDYFTPGWTDYNKRIYYETYDVTDLVQAERENAIGAILSDGWYAGNVGGRGQYAYGHKLRLRAQLQIEYQDGTQAIIKSDGSWRAAQGPIREADMQAGENYDARLEMPGWNSPGFDDRKWKQVNVGPEVKAQVQAYPGIPVRRIMEIKPVNITEPKPGVFVYNLGQNFAGCARLKVRGKAGGKVVLRFAEILNPDGTIYTTNLRTARATDTYILKGGSEETWEPQFTYHGFQYVEVTGYPGKPGLDAVTGIVMHSDLPMAGSLETSSPLVNKIYNNLLWGQRSNYFEVPTDCPQRDERLGWMGDAQAFIGTASYNMDVDAFFTKWMVDVEDAQAPDGAFRDTAPAISTGRAAGWGDAGVVVPWTVYRVYGDTRIIEQHYTAMTKWMDFLSKRSHNYISPALGIYGDWLHVNDPTPLGLIATAFYGYDAKLMAEMARAIGKEEDAKKYEAMHENVRKAFAKEFISADGKIKGDSQTAYVMALRFDLVPENLKGPVAARLVNRIEARDYYLSTGFLGLYLLMPALTEINRTDVAYRLLNNTRYPSWGYEIKLGATTVWERWNGYTTEKGFNTPTMNSFNHYAFGSVGEWLFNTLAGIDTDGPAFTKIIIHPQPGGGLTYAKASYNSIRGKISTSWRIDGGDYKLDVSIPANSIATVFIPAKNQDDVMEGNQPAQKSPQVRFLRMEKDIAVFECGSGNYSFTSKDVKITGL